MIVISNKVELKKYEKLIKSFKISNFQHTYENIYSIYLSSKDVYTFIEDNMLTMFVKKDENIYECPFNIEPIIYDNCEKEKLLNFIGMIKKYLNKVLYFPLVYENSSFYGLLNKDLYVYDRLYTSICDYTKIDNIMDKVNLSKRVHFSRRDVKKFEKNIYLQYYKKINVVDILKDVEEKSWKHTFRQDMISKNEQLLYYNSLIELGLASIAVSYLHTTGEIVAYRIDVEYEDKVYVLKTSYKEEYKKYSAGSYMMIIDLYNHYNKKCVDFYGGPSLVKDMIETGRIKRFDMLYGDYNISKEVEKNRKLWDSKNYVNFLNDKSLKEVFNKKENIIAVCSCFGLGPVGKLSAIVEYSKNDFNWYASGEEFDLKIFNDRNIFKDKCFTMDKEILKEFIQKYNIKYALVVLKNKMARILMELGIKVIYVDSLPFMWSELDAKSGKVPFDVDCYCCQKTISMSKNSKKIFANVKNLVWVNPIINNKEKFICNQKKDFVLINLGGLHSPSTNGNDYVDIVVKSIIEIYEDKDIIITTSSTVAGKLARYLKEYKNIRVKSLKQREFFNYISMASIFITSPGLTTILESQSLVKKIVFLPPQNISQFYNIEYGKKIFKYYKEITWNDKNLTMKGLKAYLSKDEQGVLEIINLNMKKMNNNQEKLKFKKYAQKVLTEDYVVNNYNVSLENNGVEQVVEQIKKIMNKK